ncbi:N-acetylated-alpha-linked acidic dipeptidase 2 [Sarcoptes scabiei]|nr:N-acetylated-alpha-linked acidic dipeptidase 2 [Sarcoptes scabiei]
MKEALGYIKERKFFPKWINFETLKTIRLNQHDIVVSDNFDGEIFEYCRDRLIRMVGPLVVNYCDPKQCLNPFLTIPLRELPIFSQCMRKLTITTSNLSINQRESIKKKVILMSGSYDTSLHSKTSFLITDSVITRKYRAAGQLKIPILTPNYIDSCWENYQHEYFRANNSKIVDQYRLPIFNNLKISVSGFKQQERDSIREIVESNGGSYEAALKLNVPNVVLVLNEKKGDKYKYARLKNLPCLKLDWIHDSVVAGYSLPFDAYNIENIKSPEKKTEIEIVPETKPLKYSPSKLKTAAIQQKSSPFKKFDVLADDPDEVCKFVDKFECENKKDLHLSQNFKPLIDAFSDEGSPPVSWSPKDDDTHIPFESQSFHSSTQIPDRKSIDQDQSIDKEILPVSKEESFSNEAVFMFSGFETEEKTKLIKNVEEILKVTVHDDPLVSHQVTHFILYEPCATEKVLAIIAAGIGILKPDYVTDCLNAKKLLPHSKYQWGLDFVQNSPKNLSRVKLMVSALRWKEYLADKKQRLFDGLKFLFLITVENSSMMSACVNILKAGGAEVILLDDFEEKESMLQSILPEIDFALIDFQFKEQPRISKRSFIECIKYLDQKNVIMSHRIISRYIIEGPGTSLQILKDKFPISFQDIRTLISRIY